MTLLSGTSRKGILHLVVLSGFLAGCGNTGELSRSEVLTVMATDLVEAMVEGDFSKAIENFGSVMRGALPSARLQVIWEALILRFGTFQELAGTRMEEVDGYEIVYVTCDFENYSMDVKIVFNIENKVAGLFFVPSSGSTE